MTVFPLIVSWFLTFGYVPQMDEAVSNRRIQLDDSRYATVAQIGLAVATEDDRLTVYGDVENFQYVSTKNVGFNPFRIDYSIGMQFRVNDYIRINLDHECDHQVSSYSNGKVDFNYTSNQTKFTVTIHGKTKLGGN